MIRRSPAAFFLALLLVAAPVSASTLIDLTDYGRTNYNNGNATDDTAAIGGTFIVQQIDPQSTGTGVISSFVRVQSSSDNEEGYNTSLQPQLDSKGGTFTRALSLTDVPVVLGPDGVLYRQFLLDINQNGDNLISLNQVQIFQSTIDRNDGVLNPAAAANTFPQINFSGATEIFRMSNSGLDTNNRQYNVLMDFQLNSGSGSGDMFLYVRADQFSASFGNYVILYSHFGNPPGSQETNDGFEEWAVLRSPLAPPCDPLVEFCEPLVSTPEPASLVLLGSGLIAAAARLRRRRTS